MSQKGFVHILLLLLLLVGLAVGVYLVGQKTNLLPKASVSKPTGPETSFTLVGPNDCASGWICALGFRSEPQPGEEFEVKLFVRSDIDEANLFQAKMKFPVNLVEVVKINTDSSFIKNWIENFYDNNTGEISLTGGVPSPGFQTKLGGESALMAAIVFKAKTGGVGTVLFNDDSAIYRNTDNENILKIKREYDISIGTKPGPTPLPFVKVTYPNGGQTFKKGDNITITWDGIGSNSYSIDLYDPDEKSWNNLAFLRDPKTRSYNWVINVYDFFLNKPVYMVVTGDSDSGSSTNIRVQDYSDQTIVIEPVSPPGPKGDGNKDGKINLVDMSVLLTDFNKEQGFREPIDMDENKKINTFDYSLHRKLLIETGVIKGQ